MHHREKTHGAGRRRRSYGEQTLAVLVLVGYVLALQGSTVGHGWSLLVHLAGEQHAELPSPTRAVSPTPDAFRVSQGAAGAEPVGAVAHHDSEAAPPNDGHTHSGSHVHDGNALGDDHARDAKSDHHRSDHRRGATHHEAHGTPREGASTHPRAHESRGRESQDRKRASAGDSPRNAEARDDWNAPHEHDGQTHTHEQKQSQSERLLLALTLDKHCFFEGPPRLSPSPDRDMDFACPTPTPGQNVLSVETPPPRLPG